METNVQDDINLNLEMCVTLPSSLVKTPIKENAKMLVEGAQEGNEFETKTTVF